jgi:putative FmdB family regulatory protein
MPLYEYKCRSCGKIFEVIQKFSDEPLKTHAECGGPVDRLFSAPAFHLKGTGWYATDYAKKNGSGEKSEESKPKSDSASESKPQGGESGGAKSTGESPKTDTNSSSSSTESKPASSGTSEPPSKSTSKSE